MLRALDFTKTAENFGGYSALARRLTELVERAFCRPAVRARVAARH